MKTPTASGFRLLIVQSSTWARLQFTVLHCNSNRTCTWFVLHPGITWTSGRVDRRARHSTKRGLSRVLTMSRSYPVHSAVFSTSTTIQGFWKECKVWQIASDHAENVQRWTAVSGHQKTPVFMQCWPSKKLQWANRTKKKIPPYTSGDLELKTRLSSHSEEKWCWGGQKILQGFWVSFDVLMAIMKSNKT